MNNYLGYIVVAILIALFAIGWHLNGKEKVNYEELGIKPDEACKTCDNFLCNARENTTENTVKEMKDALGDKKDDN